MTHHVDIIITLLFVMPMAVVGSDIIARWIEKGR